MLPQIFASCSQVHVCTCKSTWFIASFSCHLLHVCIDDGSRKSLIGKRAESTKHDEATMWLDLLHIGCGGDNYKKHVVIHEFGHALGLGHEHQRSDFWKLIERYINIEEMKKDPGLSNEPLSFQTNWGSDQESIKGECTTYDPNSIMHYW